MTGQELAAVATAAPTPYVHDVVTACQNSGRSVSVVSNNSARAVHAYLARHGLDDRIGLVVARTSHDPALLKPSPHLIIQAVEALDAEPGLPLRRLRDRRQGARPPVSGMAAPPARPRGTPQRNRVTPSQQLTDLAQTPRTYSRSGLLQLSPRFSRAHLRRAELTAPPVNSEEGREQSRGKGGQGDPS
jgi:hypothetical protein